ncbi:MAG: chemotaxis protein CheW [Pseudomonadota bacterium]
MSEAVAEARAAERLVLAFSLEGERFALDVSNVSEVLDPLPATAVPNAGAFAPAVLNVRGAVVPLVDIRQRLGMAPAASDAPQRLLVLDLTVAGEPTRVAMMADDVESIVELPAGAVEPVPALGIRWPAAFIEGVARHRDDILILLDQETVFPPAAQAVDGERGLGGPHQ